MRNVVCLSISAFLLSASSLAHAQLTDAGHDAAADASSDATADAGSSSGDDSGTTSGDDGGNTAGDDGGESCTTAGASCGALTAGQACTITSGGSIGVCTSVPCGGSTVLECLPALGGLLPDSGTDASTTTTTTTTNNTCAPHAAECAGHRLGDGCDTGDGLSGNCGEVTCGGVTTLTCVDGKGSTDGGCMVTAPDDAASIFGLVAVLAPFAAIRRRRSKKTAH